MKNSRIFHQYVWLVNTLRNRGPLTLDELDQLWQQHEVADGNPLSRSTFNRHRGAVLDMFGIIISCEATAPYRYYIENPEELDDTSVARWLMSTLTVGDVLRDSMAVRDRIILENIPVGEDYLQTIIAALKGNLQLQMRYQRFGGEAYNVVVNPYAIKLFHQRWYMLAWNGKYISTYSLDRMLSLSLTAKRFKSDVKFSPRDYYGQYYGVLTDQTPLSRVVVRAHGMTANYLRTLPLHGSQRELGGCDDGNGEPYTDFEMQVCPTVDFINALLSYGDGIEVLEPDDLRATMRSELVEALARYQ